MNNALQNESEGDNSEDSERFIQNTNLDSENQCYSIGESIHFLILFSNGVKLIKS